MTSLVTIIRRKDPLEGQRVRVLGRLRRHGAAELLVVLPDGSKRMIPQTWTDAESSGDSEPVATLGAIGDLLAVCALVAALADDREGQAARMSPCKEDTDAACPAQSAAPTLPGATSDEVGSPARAGRRRGGPVAGRSDRQSGHRRARGDAR